MNYEATIKQWIADDSHRMEALSVAAGIGLPDWCLAAGFVRNLVWDKLHDFPLPTTLNDIDLIYFDPVGATEARDLSIEHELRSLSDLPWSVKNQARMHMRNLDNPYASTSDAMSYWVEVETAVGASLGENGGVTLVSPFGVEPLFECTITLNSKRPKPKEFAHRITSKSWLEIWPRLVVSA